MVLVGIGWLLGSVVTMLIFRKFIVGILQVVEIENEDQPYLFLDLSKDVDSVIKKKYVMLKVNAKSRISHK